MEVNQMAVQERQDRGAEYKCFSSRVPSDIYNTLNDWAWEHRLSLAKACSVLLSKAMDAENGSPYIPESEVGQNGPEI